MSDTLELTAAETNAIKLMYHGETWDETTPLRYFTREQVDEWRGGQIYLLVVSYMGRDGLWGTLVESTWRGESNDLHGRETVTLVPVYAIPSVEYTTTAPAVTA